MAKKKQVKKFIAGGDVRRDAQAYSPMFIPGEGIINPPGSFGGHGGATGEVGQIRKSADRAGKFLSEAEQAIGSKRGAGGGFPGLAGIDFPDHLLNPGMKKGGKVKKAKKKRYNTGGKVRGVGRAVTKKMRPCKMVKM